MSLDATLWVWKLGKKLISPFEKLILLSMADRANEYFECWPSIKRLCLDTNSDIKTIKKSLSSLRDKGFIEKTGKMVGRTKSVPVYKLVGPIGREAGPKTDHLSDEAGPKTDLLSRPKNGPQNLSLIISKNTTTASIDDGIVVAFISIFETQFPDKPKVNNSRRTKQAIQKFIKAWDRIKSPFKMEGGNFKAYLEDLCENASGFASGEYESSTGTIVQNTFFTFIRPINVEKFYNGELR